MFCGKYKRFAESFVFLRKLWKSYPQFQKKLEDTVENQPKFSQNTGFYLVENRDGLFWIKRKTPTRRFWEC